MLSALLAFLAGFVLCSLLVPSVRATLFALDDSLDAHELAVSKVSARSPFRETGPPACMAQLIMLRHKLNQSGHRRRRSMSHARQTSRSRELAAPRTRGNAWLRIGRGMNKQVY